MQNKLIVRIAEGLGNQLFMYANAYALSRKINYNLLIDKHSGYIKNNLRFYLLDHFNITANIAPFYLLHNTFIKNSFRKINIFADKFRFKKKFIIEKKNKSKKTFFYDYLSNIETNKICFVEGHFESEKYFLDYKNDLINQFKIKISENKIDDRYYNEFKKNNTISICIRQNRFSEKNNEFLSIKKSTEFVKQTIEYIKKAEILIETKIKNPRYFIWSDNFSNLREYFPEKKYTFVLHSKDKIMSDFNLFKYSKNFIVGPTTFHWWGAWLSNNQNKICIRPMNLNPSNNKDFWPADWLVI